MEVRKVLNNGEFTTDKKKYSFFTSKGYRTPEWIWIGLSNDGVEFCDMTKKGVVSKIERDNRLSERGKFNTNCI